MPVRVDRREFFAKTFLQRFFCGPAGLGSGGMETVELKANGLVFDALADGPADGRLVMLLHGFPQTSWSWRRVMPLLVAGGCRVVAPDQRGYSPGARPDDV